jgi:hypothetical protein
VLEPCLLRDATRAYPTRKPSSYDMTNRLHGQRRHIFTSVCWLFIQYLCTLNSLLRAVRLPRAPAVCVLLLFVSVFSWICISTTLPESSEEAPRCGLESVHGICGRVCCPCQFIQCTATRHQRANAGQSNYAGLHRAWYVS